VNKNWAYIFITILLLITVQLGEIAAFVVPDIRRLRWFYLLAPPLLVGYLVRNGKRYLLSKDALTFIGLHTGIIGLLLLTHPLTNARAVLDHILMLGVGVAVAVAVYKQHLSFRTIGLGLFLGAIPVIATDVLAAARFIRLYKNWGLLGITGGIGVDVGFGGHGIILSTGIIGGWVVLRTFDLRTWTRLLVVGTCVAMFGGILFAQSRSGLLALFTGVVPIASYHVSRKIPQFDPIRAWLLSLTLFGPVIAVALASLNPKSVFSRLEQISTGLSVFTQNPVTGIGWNQFWPQYSPDVIHFTPLNYFVFGGLFTGLVYVLTLVYPLVVFLRYGLTTDSYHESVFVLLGMYLVALVEMFFWRSTPNAHHITLGMVLFAFIYNIRHGPAEYTIR
jgi:hypothetical protein